MGLGTGILAVEQLIVDLEGRNGDGASPSDAAMAKKLFGAEPDDCFILSLDHSRRYEFLVFYRPNASGWTSDLLQAGVYSKDKAAELKTRGKARPIPCVDLIPLLRPQVFISVDHFGRLAGEQKDEQP